MWLPELPKYGWRSVILSTSVATLLVNFFAMCCTVSANRFAGRTLMPLDIYLTIGMSTAFTVSLFATLSIKIVQLRRANEDLHFHATYDFLTAALNRRAFIEAIEDRLAKLCPAGKSTDAALLVIDVDNFKAINDRYGHQIGDLALVRIADTLRDSVREADLFGRLGGEEFGIFLEDVTAAEAVRIAEICREAITECPFTPDGVPHGLSVSIGIAIADPGQDFTSLFHQADHRLYRAKELGRNRIESPTVSFAA